MEKKKPAVKVEYRKLSELKPNPGNPRFIKDDKFKKLVKSLQEFPEMMELRPVVINPEGLILGGNMRYRAAVELKLKTVPVTVANLTPEQEQEFIIKDNVSGGEWDWDILANEWDLDLLAEWGLEPIDMKDQKEATDDDYVIPKDIKTSIVKGDLITIGRHRLLCGSSTDADDVSKLLANQKPFLMVTDPPYGVKYDPSWRADLKVSQNPNKMGKVQNDDNADWTEAWALSPASVCYVWHGGKFASTVQASLEACGFEIRNQIIWNKDRFAMSRGSYHWKHEPCWYAVRKGAKSLWAGDRKQSTVWDINAREDSGNGHGTQKPTECMARPMRNHEGDIYDPFIGSGTSMVAAHPMGRTCYGMELEPQYCQVVINRMLLLDPGLEVKINGKEYIHEVLEGAN